MFPSIHRTNSTKVVINFREGCGSTTCYVARLRLYEIDNDEKTATKEG